MSDKQTKAATVTKNAVITGASRGLGRAIAEKFAGNGFNLLLCSLNAKALYDAVEALQVNYPRVQVAALPCNLAIKVTAVYPGAVYTDSWVGSGVSKQRIMEAGDIADMIYACSRLSPQATVEDIVIRPQLGDL